jgi:hypothetical protein
MDHPTYSSPDSTLHPQITILHSGIGAHLGKSFLREKQHTIIPPERISPQRLVEGADAGGVEGVFRLCWDDAKLYLLVEVTDPTPMKNEHKGDSIWAGDGVELFIGHEPTERARSSMGIVYPPLLEKAGTELTAEMQRMLGEPIAKSRRLCGAWSGQIRIPLR